MGRVYNALVRAEKVNPGDRPIGRPNRRDAVHGRGTDASNGASAGASSAAGVQVTVGNIPNTEQPDARRSFGAAEAGRSAFEPRPALARRAISEQSAPAAPVVAFEEPTDVSSIRNHAVDPLFATLTREDALAVERYRTLAVKLLNLADRRKLKTVLITSAEAGEGKSTVAACAAWLLAKRPERRVLLVDANPAAPSIAGILGIDPKRGWLSLVDRSCEIKDSFVRLDPNGLYVMTPGATIAAQSADAMSSRLEEVIAELAPRFDLVIVDSPAILGSSETQRLAAVLDGSVIVARAGNTHHSKVTAARKLVPKERRLGVVLNESEAGAEIVPRKRGKSSLVGRLFGRKK